jgi:hypothetical protein
MEYSDSFAGKSKFKGRCLHCEKWGHKSVDCRDKISNANKFGKLAIKKMDQNLTVNIFIAKSKDTVLLIVSRKRMTKP